MKILIISSSDPYKLSGIVAYDIYKGLSDNNEVTLLVKFCRSKDEDVKSFLSAPQFYFSKVLNKIKRIFIKYKLLSESRILKNPDYHVQDLDQTLTLYRTSKLLKKAGIKPDVIIVLFMQSFLSYKNLYELNKTTGAPVYLYPMDMAPFTGGCHYAWDCIGYQKKCGNCPAIYSSNPTDQSNINHSYKMKYMQKTDVRLFAANSQIANQIKKSSIFQNKTIIKGIFPVPDKNIFKILPKKELREFFNIEQDAIVIFFGSVSLMEKRKGINILIESLKIVYKKLLENKFDPNKIVLLVAGNHLSNEFTEQGFNIKHIGFISNYDVLAKAYNAADFFICPSIEDAGPTMVLQSILCGTPTISFNIGYATDFINDEVNGYIAFKKNPIALSEAIIKAIYLSAQKYGSMKTEVKITSEKIDQNIMLNRITDKLK